MIESFFSTQESKLRCVLTIILFIISIVGAFILDNDMHQVYAFSCVVIAALIQMFYWSSDYDAPF